MGADKNSSRRSNSAYVPNSQPRIPTRVFQGCVVTTDLPTLGINPKQSQSENETEQAKYLATLRSLGRIVRDVLADGPLGAGGRSTRTRRMVWKEPWRTSTAPWNTNGPYTTHRRSESNLCRVDSLRPPGGQSAKLAPTKNTWLNELKRREPRTREQQDEQLARWHLTDSPHGVCRRSAKLAGSKLSPSSWRSTPPSLYPISQINKGIDTK
jgi:hypothetical protein